MSVPPPSEPQDEPASAAPDPRDRRKTQRRRKDAESAPSAAQESDRRRTDRRQSVDVPDEYRAKKRSINEYPLNSDELEFINAINAYKQAYGKPFPTWSEVLHVVKSLGYRKSVAGPGGGDD